MSAIAEGATVAVVPVLPDRVASGSSDPRSDLVTIKYTAGSESTSRSRWSSQFLTDLLRRDRWRGIFESAQGIFRLTAPGGIASDERLDPRWLIEVIEGPLLSIRNVLPTPFTLSGSTRRQVPEWWEGVASGVLTLMTLEHDWDSQGSGPPEVSALLDAVSLLSVVLRPSAVAPAVVPLSHGAVQLEWHRGGADVEIVVGDVEDAGIYVSDSSGTWEASVEELQDLQELSRRLEKIAGPQGS